MAYKQTFYVVWAEAPEVLRKRHSIRLDAEIAAKYLCEQLGQEVFVLECVYSVEPAKFVEHQYDVIPG